MAARGWIVRHAPGGILVLHPDEPHDGQAGTDAGERARQYIHDTRGQAPSAPP